MGNTIMVIIALLTTGIFLGTTIAVSMESVLLVNVIINKIFKKMDEITKFFTFLPIFALIFILTFHLNFMAGTVFVNEKTGYGIILRLIAVIILDMFILIPIFRKFKKLKMDRVKNLTLEPIIEKTEENNKKKGFDNMENLKQELREKADKLEELTGLDFKASVKNNGERDVKKVVFSPDLAYPYEKVILDVDTGDITFAFSNETTLMMGDPKKYIKKADEIFKMYQKL